MTVQDYLRIIQRRWLLIAACGGLGILAAFAVLATVPPTYTAEARVLVSLDNARTPAELEQGNNFIQARTRSYVVAARSPLVLDSVIDQLGLPENAQSLARRVEAAAELNTVVITIAVKDASAAQATEIADSLVRNFISSIEAIESPSDSAASLVKLSLLAPATEPQSPSAPNTAVILAAGTAAGFGLGLGLAFALSRLAFRIRTVHEIGLLTSLPVLGAVVYDGTDPGTPRGRRLQQVPRTESYREMRTALLAADSRDGRRSILVTSSIPGEGKNEIAADLAASLAQAGQRVVLLDADFRSRPGLAEHLGWYPEPGLSDVLQGRLEARDVLFNHGTHHLDVMPAGSEAATPAELVDSPALENLLRDFHRTYDSVVLAGPPLANNADAAVLASKVDGVVLAVRLGQSTSRQLKRALLLLEASGSTVLGIIASSVPRKAGRRALAVQESRTVVRPAERVRQ